MKLEKKSFASLVQYLSDTLLIDCSTQSKTDRELLLSLFSDRNLNGNLIDAFSSKNITFLNDENISHCIKKSIVHDQDKFKKIFEGMLEFDISKLSTTFVDGFIQYRNQLQQAYQCYIMEHLEFGQTMRQNFKKKFNLELDLETLSQIGFESYPFSGFITFFEEDGQLSRSNYIRMPLVSFCNRGNKGLDVSVIHELIHRVETEGNQIGLESVFDGRNRFINEIRTQKLAIYITRQMHEQGIFIYDDPNNYKIEGESRYEQLFPLAEAFLDEFGDVLSHCAIDHRQEPVDALFGSSWGIYTEYINRVGNDVDTSFEFEEVPMIQLEPEIVPIIEDMRQRYYYEKGGGRSV